MDKELEREISHNKIDWMITIIPLSLICSLSLIFFFEPEKSNLILGKVRFFLGDTLGVYYLAIGLGIFLSTVYCVVSPLGNIVLGCPEEKPKYAFFIWGSMMFTAGLAADILFYSFSEWILYATDPYVKSLGNIQDWASVYPIFHWSLIPWGFYLMLAVAFGFMLHVRKRDRQKFSEACRPILGNYTDGMIGRLVDLLAVFALLSGTATTFSLATPLMSNIITELLGISIDLRVITISILIVTCCVYTYSLLYGFKGIALLAKLCVYLFFGLICYVLLASGDAKYIIETGFSAIGRMLNNFFELSTFSDPKRLTSFPQNWTIFYWAYWMVWCVAAPFFIGSISHGRTVKQVICGGYLFGAGSTVISFIVLGNYSLGLQVSGVIDFISVYSTTGDLYGIIISMIKTIPYPNLVLVVVLVNMITFYATSFDSIALIASCYSYRRLKINEQPNRLVQFLWCILLIVLPIALVFAESSMNNLQSVSIIAAFPIGLIIILITMSFFKDADNYLKEDNLK